MNRINTRSRLVHCDLPGTYQAITYRLGDALPQEVIRTWERGHPARDSLQKRQYIERYLDGSHGSCLLKHPVNAEIVIDSWKYNHGKQYDLIAYVVMPNHVHLVIKTYSNHPLNKIVHSWKSYTAQVINNHIRCGQDARTPRIWQRGYWDRMIRNKRHLNVMIDYIHNNPVKAFLCLQAKDWPWSSVNEFSGI